MITENTLAEALSDHKHICWYPAAGLDFRAPLFLSEQYVRANRESLEKNIDFLPDLFLMTDIYPFDGCFSYIKQNVMAFSKAKGDPNGGVHSDFRDKKGDIGTDENGVPLSEPWCTRSDCPRFGTPDCPGAHCGRGRLSTDSYLFFKNGSTEMRIKSFRWLEPLDEYKLSREPVSVTCGGNDGRSLALYGKVCLMRAEIFSCYRYLPEDFFGLSDQRPMRDTWETDIAYVYTDNVQFLTEYLVPNKINIDYLLSVRYTTGDGGFSLLPPEWLRCALLPLNVKYYIYEERMESRGFDPFLDMKINDCYGDIIKEYFLELAELAKKNKRLSVREFFRLSESLTPYWRKSLNRCGKGVFEDYTSECPGLLWGCMDDIIWSRVCLEDIPAAPTK